MYERRLLRLFFAIAALLVLVLGRTFQLQVLHADQVLAESSGVLRSTTVVQPRRGEILWSDGTPAVRNATRWALRIEVPTLDARRLRCGDCGEISASKTEPKACAECGGARWAAVPAVDLAALASVLDVTEADLRTELDRVRAEHEKYRWRSIEAFRETRFTPDVARALAARAADFPGVEARPEPCRDADPEIRELAGGTHVAYDTDVDALTRPERAVDGFHVHTRAEAMRTLVGHSGLEARRDEELRGVPGVLERPPVRRGAPVPEPEVVRAVVDGRPVRTTLRRDVQREAQRVVASSLAAGARGAAVVVLDLRDGAVVALTSRSDDPYFRPVVALMPGSVFKLVPALATLASGIDPHATLDCAGRGEVRRGVPYKCTGVHPGADLWTAFGKSCNHYFMRRAEDAGAAALRDAYERLGFAEDVRLGVGVAPKRAFVRRWDVNTAQLGIGQAEALATPLQIATAYARLATGGRRVVPYLDPDVGPSPQSREFDPVLARHAPTLLEAARRTVLDGTGRNVAALVAVSAAGKSGTAEVEAGGGRRVHNAWFAGYAPHDAPRWVVVVVHERVDREHGAEFAGPGAGSLLEVALRER